jgi:hypothetical protein
MTDVARRVQGTCAVALVLLVMAACNSGEEKGPKEGELKLHGTVHMVTTADSATCWKFSSTKGHDYELQAAQAPTDLLVDGASAVLVVTPLKGGGSFCNVGEVVSLVTVDSVNAPGASGT